MTQTLEEQIKLEQEESAWQRKLPVTLSEALVHFGYEEGAARECARKIRDFSSERFPATLAVYTLFLSSSFFAIKHGINRNSWGELAVYMLSALSLPVYGIISDYSRNLRTKCATKLEKDIFTAAELNVWYMHKGGNALRNTDGCLSQKVKGFDEVQESIERVL